MTSRPSTRPVSPERACWRGALGPGAVPAVFAGLLDGAVRNGLTVRPVPRGGQRGTRLVEVISPVLTNGRAVRLALPTGAVTAAVERAAWQVVGELVDRHRSAVGRGLLAESARLQVADYIRARAARMVRDATVRRARRDRQGRLAG